VELAAIVIGETGWHTTNQTLKAHSFVAALQQVFFKDPDVIAVLPCKFTSDPPLVVLWANFDILLVIYGPILTDCL
jgi:hypothetical protein